MMSFRLRDWSKEHLADESRQKRSKSTVKSLGGVSRNSRFTKPSFSFVGAIFSCASP